MNERRRPPRRGRGTRPSSRKSTENGGDENPYREAPASDEPGEPMESMTTTEAPFERPTPDTAPPPPSAEAPSPQPQPGNGADDSGAPPAPVAESGYQQNGPRPEGG